MGEAIWLGVLLGIGAAVAVGPVFVTIIQETLARGFAAGFYVVLGAALADALLLIPALTTSWLISQVDQVASYICLFGIIFLVYLSIEAARDAYRLWNKIEVDPATSTGGGWSFGKGLLGNLLNPLTWIFWLTTGATMTLRIVHTSGWRGLILFVGVFQAVLLLTETTIAFVATCTRQGVGIRGKAILTTVSSIVFLGLAGKLLTNLSW
jgi:threonine/homoserine/homoserine lactone efflux protein